MATFTFKPYTYVPTALRSKSATSYRKPTSKPVNIFDKLQRIKPSSAKLSTPQSAAAGDCGSDELRIRENEIVTNENDDDCDLPSIEQLLYNTLQKESSAAEDQPSNNTAFEIGDRTTNERGGSLDDNGSAPGDYPSGTPRDPIVLLGDDDSSASEAEVDDGGLRAESAAADEGLLDSLENIIDSTTPAPPNSDAWHDIDDVLETAERLRHSEPNPSTSDSMRPHTSSPSRASSAPLHDHISAAGQCTFHASSEATLCSPTRRHQPSLCARASTENQPIHEDHPYTGRGSADEHELELLGSILDTDPVDEGERQQQELVQREDEAHIEDDGPQQEVNDLAAVVTTEKVDDTYPSDEDGSPRPAERQRLSPSRDPLPKSSHDEVGSRSNGGSDDELNDNKADSEDNDEELRPMKRKRPSSSHDGPMHQKRKRKHRLQQRSTRQHRLHSKPHRRSLRFHSLQRHDSRVTAMSNTEVRLPLLTPFALHATDTDKPSDCYDVSRSSSDILPTLTKVTFRPHSLQYCFFTAVVRDGRDGRGVSFSQLAQLIESVGQVGKIDDFTIKPMEPHSFLVTGFSQHTSSRLSLQHSKVVDTGALSSEGSEPSNSDDESYLSDSDSDLSGDGDACLRKRKQGASTRINIAWEPVDEQRLLAYKKEDKSWEWIFKKFPGRTQAAVRTRWTMVQQRVK